MTWRRCDRLIAASIVTIAVSAASLCAASDPGVVDADAVDARMRSMMSMHNVPGAALALLQDGRIALQKGYGSRDLEARSSVTTATLFNIGSISKSFTALGVAQLVDRHQADLDTPVVDYVPELRLSDPNADRKVTLRQLLSHTNGLPADEDWPPQVPPTRSEIVDEFATMPVTAEPGARFQYCSRCVVLAACVLERITAKSWKTYTRAQIFEPLGMPTAAFGPLGLERAADRARPYRDDASSGDVVVPWSRLQYLESLAPGGGIDASIAEMARYVLFQLGNGAIDGNRVISAEAMEELHRPQIAVGPPWASPERRDLHYALGWFTAEYRGLPIVYHNGANPAFRAAIVLVPVGQGRGGRPDKWRVEPFYRRGDTRLRRAACSLTPKSDTSDHSKNRHPRACPEDPCL